MACSILLSIATALVPDALEKRERREKKENQLCISTFFFYLLAGWLERMAMKKSVRKKSLSNFIKFIYS
jgi:hypothetical protein